MAEWIDVAPEQELPPGAWRTVEVDGILVAVFNIDGEYYAIEDVCTHDGDTLTGGEREGCEIICPRHGARFDITSGEALTAPAYEDLPTYAVRRQGGMIQVYGEPD